MHRLIVATPAVGDLGSCLSRLPILVAAEPEAQAKESIPLNCLRAEGYGFEKPTSAPLPTRHVKCTTRRQGGGFAPHTDGLPRLELPHELRLENEPFHVPLQRVGRTQVRRLQPDPKGLCHVPNCGHVERLIADRPGNAHVNVAWVVDAVADMCVHRVRAPVIEDLGPAAYRPDRLKRDCVHVCQGARSIRAQPLAAICFALEAPAGVSRPAKIGADTPYVRDYAPRALDCPKLPADRRHPRLNRAVGLEPGPVDRPETDRRPDVDIRYTVVLA